jgi:hypothetical protein
LQWYLKGSLTIELDALVEEKNTEHTSYVNSTGICSEKIKTTTFRVCWLTVGSEKKGSIKGDSHYSRDFHTKSKPKLRLAVNHTFFLIRI